MRFHFSLLLIIALPGCSLEDFEITTCSSNGRLAFRIHEIDGPLWDYQPRPSLVLVRVAGTGGTQPGAMWDASVKFKSSDERKSRKLMLYGQHLPEWEVEVPPQQLRAGTEYTVYMNDGGHSGHTQFVAGDPLPTC